MLPRHRVVGLVEVALAVAVAVGAGVTAYGAAAGGASRTSAGARAAGTLVFYSHRTPSGGLYAESAAGGSLRLLRTGADWTGALWAPDGRHYLFQVPGNPAWESQLWIADADGGRARRVAANASQPGWAPDSVRIAFVRDGAVWTIRRDGSGARRVIGAQGEDGFLADPTWSPDGNRIAFRSDLSSPAGGHDSALLVVGATGGTPRLLARCVYFPPSWAPAGDRIAFDSCGPNGRDVAPGGGVYVQNVRSGARRRIAETTGPVAWSRDGRWIALAVAGQGVQVIRPDGSGMRRLFAADYSSTPAWAPDSKRLAIAYGRPSDVWIIGLDRRAKRITMGWRHGYDNASPAWHPRNLPVARLGGRIVSPAIPTDSIIRKRVLAATRPVAALAADGSRVAIDYGPGRSSSPLVETWDAPAGRIVRFNAHGYQPAALAGDRLAVAQFSHAMGTNSYGIAVATVKRPNPIAVSGLCTSGSGSPGGPCIRDPVGDLAGDGSLLVFDSWKGPEPYCNLPCPPPKRDGRLYRIDHGAAVLIATSSAELTPLAVDNGRILVSAGAGALAVLTATGTTLATIAAPAFTVAALQGGDLVVQRGTTLDDYSSTSGALLHRWPLPGDAGLADVDHGIAVYTTSTAIHLLRLVDGRDTAITPAGAGPLHAQLEPPGLFYAYQAGDAARPGRVAFVPAASLPIGP